MNYSWVSKYAVGWGLGLWLIGYVLGIILYAALPASIMGWIIMPIGVVITMWVLVKRVRAESLSAYAILGIVWTVIAVAFDYVFIVIAFGSTDYYKPDVYVYYALTFLLPLGVGVWTKVRQNGAAPPAAPAPTAAR